MADAMSAFLAKLYSTLSPVDDVNEEAPPIGKNNFMMYCLPGIPFAPESLNFVNQGLKNASSINAASDFSRLVNFIPDSRGFYQPPAGKRSEYKSGQNLVWDKYNNTLQMATVKPGNLSETETEKLKKAQQYLLTTTYELEDPLADESKDNPKKEKVQPSRQVREYETYKGRYSAALMNYNAKLKAAQNDEAGAAQDFTLNGELYRSMVRGAFNEWVTNGYKNEIEKSRAAIDNLTARDPILAWQDRKDRLARGERTDITSGAKFYLTTFLPPKFADDDEQSLWTELKFAQEDIKRYEKEKNNKWNVDGGGLSYSLFRVSVGTESDIKEKEYEIDTSKMEISLKICRVTLIRPWFDPGWLTSNFWKWSEDKMPALSDGNIPPKGELIGYPTEAIFARDLIIKLNATSEKNKEAITAIKGNVGVSFGPFSLGGGSFSHSNTTKDFERKVTDDSITVKGLQIIAFNCALLPKSPNHNW